MFRVADISDDNLLLIVALCGLAYLLLTYDGIWELRHDRNLPGLLRIGTGIAMAVVATVFLFEGLARP